MEPFPSSPRLGTASHNQSCIVVSPSSPNQHHTIRNIEQENSKTNSKHLYDLETEIHDCKLHGYQYSTLQEPRRTVPKSSEKTPHKIMFPNRDTLSNLAKRSISSQTIYRHKDTTNRQKTKRSEHHCHHIDSSPPCSPKNGSRIPPPPPPPRSLKCAIKSGTAENSRQTTYEDEVQRSDANEDTTSEFEDDDDIDDNADGSQRSSPDITESSRYPNSRHRDFCSGVVLKDQAHKIYSSTHNHVYPRSDIPPESCLTCVNPNHYHHYHHQVGNFIAPITLITSSGIPGEHPKHFFLRQSTTPYLHSNVKTVVEKTQSNVEDHDHECKCKATFQTNPTNQMTLNRTLSNPTMVTVPQPYREAPQLHRYDKSVQYNTPSQIGHSHEMISSPSGPDTTTSEAAKNFQEVRSVGEGIELQYREKTDIISDNDRRRIECNMKADNEQENINQVTSENHLHDQKSGELENEMICPPPPPVPYGTLRYSSFNNRCEVNSNNLEKSNTTSSNVESSGDNSISSNSSVLATIQGEETRQNFNPNDTVYEKDFKKKTAPSNLAYNHMFKSKFTAPNSMSCTSTWNGDIHLHESPTANSSSSSSYIPPVSKELHDGNNMDSGL